jgi:kynureninase
MATLVETSVDDADFAARMDAEDPLQSFRSQFHMPKEHGKQMIYLCGHSLGLQPVKTREYIGIELDEWANRGVEGHFHPECKRPWAAIDKFTRPLMAELVGAKTEEVAVMNGLTPNLHLMMVSFYRPTATRYKILTEKSAFPSDQYAVQSQIRFHGREPADALVELSPRDGETFLHDEDILAVIAEHGPTIALVMLPGVQYLTGQFFDIPKITRAARAQGCAVGWDCAHAVGNVVLDLHDSDADFAVWCSYKYCNSGPGGIAGAFVHERHAKDATIPRFSGWWGHNSETRFKMPDEFDPEPGAQGWALNNPPVFQCVSLIASLELFHEATLPRLREKSEKLTGYLERLLNAALPENLIILTPTDKTRRGCMLTMRFRGVDLKAVFHLLAKKGVICDVREPDIMRVAPCPLYNSFTDVHSFVLRLREAVRELSSKI